MARAKKTITTETSVITAIDQTSEPVLEIQNSAVNITETVNNELPVEANTTPQVVICENVRPIVDQDSINRERLRRRLLGYC